MLRLTLASLVIFGHAPEVVDGNRTREPLTAVFHTLSLGELSVDGFFLLSGYLITTSFLRSSSVGDYLWRRLMRIVPAFVVAFGLCVLVLAPLAGGNPLHGLSGALRRLVLLRSPPDYPGMFDGLPTRALNGSLWTISYEFRCYVLVAILGLLGVLKRLRLVAGLTALLVAASVATTFIHPPAPGGVVDLLIGDPAQTIRLTAVFMVGACVCLGWTGIEPYLTGRIAGLCCVGALACMFQPNLAEAGLMTFGAVSLFWLALKADLGPVQSVNDKWDISYGVYLYGWPVTIGLLWFSRGAGPWTLAPIALLLACLLGAASWWGLEKKTKGLPVPILAGRTSPTPA